METSFLAESELPECARLQFPSSSLQEDQQLAEALNKSSEEGFKTLKGQSSRKRAL